MTDTLEDFLIESAKRKFEDHYYDDEENQGPPRLQPAVVLQRVLDLLRQDVSNIKTADIEILVLEIEDCLYHQERKEIL
jgi:hypothetical protein